MQINNRKLRPINKDPTLKKSFNFEVDPQNSISDSIYLQPKSTTWLTPVEFYRGYSQFRNFRISKNFLVLMIILFEKTESSLSWVLSKNNKLFSKTVFLNIPKVRFWFDQNQGPMDHPLDEWRFEELTKRVHLTLMTELKLGNSGRGIKLVSDTVCQCMGIINV